MLRCFLAQHSQRMWCRLAQPSQTEAVLGVLAASPAVAARADASFTGPSLIVTPGTTAQRSPPHSHLTHQYS